MKMLPCICILLCIVACSQTADITVDNYAGPDLAVEIDGKEYLLDDGESITQEIEIGKKFIFGPDDKCIPVEGEGLCRFHFSEMVTVEDGDHKILTIYGDAGYIGICNYTSDYLFLYLAPCAATSWGSVIDVLSPGECTPWIKVDIGCWCFKVTNSGALEHCGIIITPCLAVPYDIVPLRLQIEGGVTDNRSSGVHTFEAVRKEIVDVRKIKDELQKGGSRIYNQTADEGF